MEQRAFQKFQAKVATSPMKDLLFAIKQFYIGSNGTQPDWSPELEQHFNSLSLSELRDICNELAIEAINMDMIAFVTKGNRGNFLNEMYKYL